MDLKPINIIELSEKSKQTDKEVFEILEDNNSLKLEFIVSPGSRNGFEKWYQQDEDEFIYLIQGEAIIEFKDLNQLRLIKGDYFKIPAGLQHRIAFTSTSPHCIWLTIFKKNKDE